jgi:glycosyltransferase involved in cell wall biosynthesis
VNRIVHFCYSGTSGSTRVALNISRGSDQPERHAYVFYGVEPLREDYASELLARGCHSFYVAKEHGLDLKCYQAAAEAIAQMRSDAVFFHGARSLPVEFCLRRLEKRGQAPLRVAVQHGPAQQYAAAVGLSHLADFTVVVSRGLAESLRGGWFFRLACPAARMRVIPNGVDDEFWRPNDADPQADRHVGESVVGMIGTLERYKDQPTLIRAVGRLRRRGLAVRLELAGAGSRRSDLEALARSEGLAEAVKFLGDLAPEALREAMSGWDVLAHSTHSEGLSMALLEGMMAGMPIVASDVPGVRQAVQNRRTGLLSPPRAREALTSEIAELLENPDLAARLGTAARAHAMEHFSMRRMTREYEEIAGLGK